MKEKILLIPRLYLTEKEKRGRHLKRLKTCPDCGEKVGDIFKEVDPKTKYKCRNCGYYIHIGRFAFTIMRGEIKNEKI